VKASHKSARAHDGTEATESALVCYARARSSLTPTQKRDGDACVVMLDHLRECGEQLFRALADELAHLSGRAPLIGDRRVARKITSETSTLLATVRLRGNGTRDRALVDHALSTAEWLMKSTADSTEQLARNLTLLKRAKELSHARS
jgi:hypothetical protein